MDKQIIYAAFLCRVSTFDQSNQSQVKTLNQIINEADENIIVKPKHIFEEKISGYTDTRKSVEKLKQAVENNEIDRIYCIEFTRLSRKPQTLINEYEYFVNKKIPIYFVNEDCWTLDKDTRTIVTNTRERLYGAALWGEQELQKIRQRTMRGRAIKAKEGYFVGHVAFGYRVGLSENGTDKIVVIHPEESIVVREIFEKVAYKEYTTTAITKWLNMNNIKSKWVNWVEQNPTKKQTYLTNRRIERLKSDINWTYSTVKMLIKNRWYVGERKYKDYTINHEPIVDEELFRLANSKLKENKKIDNAKSPLRIYCLSNIFYCGKCGKTMNAHTGHISATYYCSSKETGHKCGDVGISKENIEMLLIKLITHLSTNISADKFLQNYLTLEQTGMKNLKSKTTELNNLNENIKHENELIVKQITSLTIDKSKQQIPEVKIAIEVSINELNNEYQRNEKLIGQNVSQIGLLNSQLSKNSDAKSIIISINDKKDLNQIATIFHQLIEKCTLYNVNPNIALIQVVFNSERTINVIYQRRKTKYNFEISEFLNKHPEFGLHKPFEISALNTPQHIYFFDNDVIRFDKLDNTFTVMKQEIFSSFSTLIIVDDKDYAASEYIEGQKENNTYYSSCKQGTIELEKMLELLIYWHSLTFDLFYNKESDTYINRNEASKRFSQARKEKNKSSKVTKKSNPIELILEFKKKRKSIYSARYKIRNNSMLTSNQKEEELNRLENELTILKSTFNLNM